MTIRKLPIILHGRQNKVIGVKEGYVVIKKESGIFSSERRKEIPISQITGVEVKKPGAVFAGYIQIQTAGQISSNSSYTFSGGAYDAARDENAVVFDPDDAFYQRALEIKDEIIRQINQHK